MVESVWLPEFAVWGSKEGFRVQEFLLLSFDDFVAASDFGLPEADSFSRFGGVDEVAVRWRCREPVIGIPRTVLMSFGHWREGDEATRRRQSQIHSDFAQVFGQPQPATLESALAVVVASLTENGRHVEVCLNRPGAPTACRAAIVDAEVQCWNEAGRTIECGPENKGLIVKALRSVGILLATPFPSVRFEQGKNSLLFLDGRATQASGRDRSMALMQRFEGWESRWKVVVPHLSQSDLKYLGAYDVADELPPGLPIIGVGHPVSGGHARGVACLTKRNVDAALAAGKRPLLLAEAPAPELLPLALQSVATVFRAGAHTAHIAVVARGEGKPCVVGVPGLRIQKEEETIQFGDRFVPVGTELAVDGSTGAILLASEAEWSAASAAKAKASVELSPVRSQTGSWPSAVKSLRSVAKTVVWANADTAAQARAAIETGAQGVGLVRLERTLQITFPDTLKSAVAGATALQGRTSSATEAVRRWYRWGASDGAARVAQARLSSARLDVPKRYLDALKELEEAVASEVASIARAADGVPIVIRLLDASLQELFFGPEEFIRIANGVQLTSSAEVWTRWGGDMGMRGVRLSLAEPLLLAAQLKACLLVQRETGADLRLLVPLVTDSFELEAVAAMMSWLMGEDKSNPLPLGCMLETPASILLLPELVPLADFFALGTNDLDAYTRAMGRSSALAALEEVAPYKGSESAGAARGSAATRQLASLALESIERTGVERQIGVCGEWASQLETARYLSRAGFHYLSAPLGGLPVALLGAAQGATDREATDRR